MDRQNTGPEDKQRPIINEGKKIILNIAGILAICCATGDTLVEMARPFNLNIMIHSKLELLQVDR